MLEKVKVALRITSNVFDDELEDLITSARSDLGIAGVTVPTTTDTDTDKIVNQAIITYCKMNFGAPVDYDRLKRSYDEQKSQLSMATGYTTWSVNNG